LTETTMEKAAESRNTGGTVSNDAITGKKLFPDAAEVKK